MVYVVNKSQQLLKAAVYPISAYSRVVSLSTYVDNVTRWNWVFTQGVGNRVWLQDVQIWVLREATELRQRVRVYIKQARMMPQSREQVRGLDDVLPLYDGRNFTPWWIETTEYHRQWGLSKLYVGEPIRFGVMVENIEPVHVTLDISFRIAEG